jgi:hypothetical protein
MVLDKWSWTWRKKELVVLKKDIGDYVFTWGNYPMQPHYPGMGRGLVRSLSAFVQEASHYMRVCRTPESWVPQGYGQ